MGLVGVPFEGGFRLGRGWVGRARHVQEKEQVRKIYIRGIRLGKSMGRERELCARKFGFLA